MDFHDRLGRGIRLYVVLLGSALLLAGVWWLNGSLLGNTADETGWPVMVGVVAALVVAVSIARLLFAESDDEPYESHDDQYDWQS